MPPFLTGDSPLLLWRVLVRVYSLYVSTKSITSVNSLFPQYFHQRSGSYRIKGLFLIIFKCHVKQHYTDLFMCGSLGSGRQNKPRPGQLTTARQILPQLGGGE